MHRSTARMAGLLAFAAAALVGLSGCTVTTDRPVTTATRTVTASVPASQSASAATPSASAGTVASSPSSTPRTDPDAPAGQCPDAALAVSVQYDPEAAGAGQRGAFVVFRNTGSGSCTLEGAPGLSLVGGGDGTQIGDPADRSTTGAKPVPIPAGAYALAQVTYTYVDEHGGNFDDGSGHDVACRAKAADGYRVFPPHSYRAFFSAYRTYACSTSVRWISVGPVKPASAYAYFAPKQ